MERWPSNFTPMKINHLILTSLTALAAVFTSISPAHAAAPAGKPQQLASPDQTPEGLSKSDWSSIRAAYEAGRHAFQPVEGGWQARNPGQQWTTRFDGRGFVSQPREGDWTWGLELQTYGFPGAEQAKPIPFDQLGAEAQKKYTGDGISIAPTAGGARLRAIMQRLEGDATTGGLWLTSTADEDAGRVNRFRVRAMGLGRAGQMSLLSSTGVVQATTDAAVWLRPGLAEEYAVSTDGVRQDFVVAEAPTGAGELVVELEVSGAQAQQAAHGATLTVESTGRELAYHRLHVTDATGRVLTARIEVAAPQRLRVAVEDAGAVYPVRIDPTFSDADWVSMNPGIPGASAQVSAMVVDGTGNLIVGGMFTFIGTVPANRIAKWNGSAWSALGSGMDGQVLALAVIGSDLYAGGSFTTAGGVSANRIAKWNGSAWSALGTGMNNIVRALAVSGSDLYAGGSFTSAGVVSASRIAKWDGSAWSALGTGMNSTVRALAVSGSDLYAGGSFTTAGGTTASFIAKWNGSAWSALGSGMNNTVFALAVSGSDLYAGGDFTSAGGVSANRIAKWNGSAWSALGTGMNSTVRALAVSGSDLYA
ncbi:MAG: hypothetical protein RL088_475, partial [Verrucomicrobiota bacterium]